MVQQRHALYYTEIAEAAEPELWGENQAARIEQMEQEHDNIRTALRWVCSTGDIELALRLSGSVGRFWDLCGYPTEGRSWFQSIFALQPQEPTIYRARALHQAGMLANRHREYDTAVSMLSHANEIFNQLGDKVGEGNVLNGLAITVMDREYDKAIDYWTKSLALRRQTGPKSSIASTLHNMSYTRMHQGRWDEAIVLSLEAQDLYKEENIVLGVAYTHYVLGNVAAGRGDLDAAETHLLECLQGARQMHSTIMVAWTLSDLGEVLFRQEQYERANEMLAEAKTMFTQIGDTLGLAVVSTRLGREAQRIAHHADARTLYAEALKFALEIENPLAIGSSLAGFAGVAAASGKPGDAALLFGYSQHLLSTVSTNLERRAMTLGLNGARAALGDEAWEAAWSEGCAMTLKQAIELAQHRF
jgi:tetratricopeptide (TPR) repeat protein